MLIKAEQKFVRMSPRKLRLVSDAIKKVKTPEVAISYLEQVPKRATRPIIKVIKQAVANAKNNFKLATDGLRIREIVISAGPVYKRSQPAYGGRANLIQKRTSHIKVILETKEETTANRLQSTVKKENVSGKSAVVSSQSTEGK